MSDGMLHCEKCGATGPRDLAAVLGGRDRWFEHINQPPNDGLDPMLNVFCDTCVDSHGAEICRLTGEMNRDSAWPSVATVNRHYADWRAMGL